VLEALAGMGLRLPAVVAGAKVVAVAPSP
jgi:hypothetical protein